MKQHCEFYCFKKTRGPNKKITKKSDKIELVIFDMDGVLTDILSSWKYIHDYFKTSNERSVNAYLKGKFNDAEFIRRDAALWRKNGKPVKREKIVEILSEVPLMNGAKECVSYLKEKGIKTAIISAGLDILANRVAKELGIEHVYSNGIKSNNQGYLNEEAIVGVKLIYKDENVEKLSNLLNIPLSKIATIGNSCFDIPMFEVSGLGIAFNPEDDCVRDAADLVVESKDVRKLTDALNDYI
jgi:phosphoserine phosphatase